jgi:hypothetical protein
VVVNGANASGDGPISFSLRAFNVPTTAGKITATPNPLSGAPGTPVTVRLSWPALQAGAPYLGLVSYSGSDRTTLVAVG